MVQGFGFGKHYFFAFNWCVFAKIFFWTCHSFLHSQALNNLQATYKGFGLVNSKNVFKVCDEPHPMLIKNMLLNSSKGEFDEVSVKIHLFTGHTLYLLVSLLLYKLLKIF